MKSRNEKHREGKASSRREQGEGSRVGIRCCGQLTGRRVRLLGPLQEAGAGGCSQPPRPSRPFPAPARPQACAAHMDAPRSGTEGAPWSSTSSGRRPEDPESCPHKDDAFPAPGPSAPRSCTDLSREEARPPAGRSETTPRTGYKPQPRGSPGPHIPSCYLHLGG